MCYKCEQLKQFLTKINPVEGKDDVGLFFGAKYRLFNSKGEKIGIFTYTKDEVIGDSFQRTIVTPDGELAQEVASPSRWELLPDSEQID